MFCANLNNDSEICKDGTYNGRQLYHIDCLSTTYTSWKEQKVFFGLAENALK